MIWISFAVGAFIGAMIGMMVMALAVASGKSSEVERLMDAYWQGRKEEIKFLKTL